MVGRLSKRYQILSKLLTLQEYLQAQTNGWASHAVGWDANV
jgi:hypothetical protein